MIIARLQGGLGNQLFQYAAAKALSVRLQQPYKLEAITSLRKDRQRVIALDDLQADFTLAAKKELRRFVWFPSLYRHRPSLFAKLGRNIYQEPHFHFDEGFLNITAPVYLDGFWQSPLYFKDIEEEIRKDFAVKPKLIENVIEKGKELELRSSISIHIRRGDFLNPKAAAYHGVLDRTYYDKAIQLVQKKVPGASLHFFSDDIDWARQNLPGAENAEYISLYTQSAIEDFYLMTKCRYNIIANSSFSWWAAWLNAHPDKIVVAPQQWFAESRLDTRDLIPSGWLQI